MIASAKNGFMNTNPFDLHGTRVQLPAGVLDRQGRERHPVGHRALHDQHRVRDRPLGGLHQRHRPGHVFTLGKFKDTFYKQCHGPYETKPDTGKTFEPNDSPCYKKGDTHGGTVAPNLVTGCDVFFGAIGDLDYDGQPYWADWPNSVQPGHVPVAVPAAGADLGRAPVLADPVHDRHQRHRVQHQLQPGHRQGLRAPAEGTGALLPVLHAGEGRRQVRVGVRQHAATATRSAGTSSTARSGRARWARSPGPSAGTRPADRSRPARPARSTGPGTCGSARRASAGRAPSRNWRPRWPRARGCVLWAPGTRSAASPTPRACWSRPPGCRRSPTSTPPRPR